MVSQQFLNSLLMLPESATLEFKEDIHLLFDSDGKKQKAQRHEFIKDILSLANGSANTAGENAYIVFGISDDFTPGIPREIKGIKNRIPDIKEILQIVNAYCFPKLDNILPETLQINSATIFVITILPSPYLHETTQQLETPKRRFTEFTVFIRRNEIIDVASARDRAAIQDLKQIRITEGRRVDPTIFGFSTGSIVGGAITSTLAPKWTNHKAEQVGAGIAGSVMGGILGASIGSSVSSLIRTREELYSVPRDQRPFAIVLSSLAGVGTTILLQKILNYLHRFIKKMNQKE